MTGTVQKKLAILNVNVDSDQLDELWSEVEGVLHYDGKPYILETFWADLLEKNVDDPLAGHLVVKKTIELLARNYLLNTRVDVEKDL